jgi:diguanylate cyclase (GGDEF)-like protein
MSVSAPVSPLKSTVGSSSAADLPPDLYVELVNALFKGGWSLAMGCAATSIAALITAVVTHSLALYGFSVSLPIIAALRLWDMIAHARTKPEDDVATASRWKRRYVIGASAYMAALGFWSLAVFTVTDDGFLRILAFSATLCHALGIATRNFSIKSLTDAQIFAGFLPLSAALALAGGYYPVIILVVLIPFFFFVKTSATRLRSTLLDEVLSKRSVTQLASQLDSALNNMSHGLCMLDTDGNLSVSNDQIAKMLGVPKRAVRSGANIKVLLRLLVRAGAVTRTDADKLNRTLRTHINVPDHSLVANTPDGRSIEVNVHHMSDDGAVIVTQDITERRTAEAAIYRMVWFDPVTGLPNRRRFEKELSAALLTRQNERENGAILFLDLDDFKQVNDSLGHARGDKLLSAVGDRLRSSVEDRDVVARWGGDEFAILLSPRENAREPSYLADRIILEINRPFQIDGYEIIVGASVGVARIYHDGLTLETLLSNADLALYAAKGEGRNRWRSYERQLGLHAQSRRTLEIDLRAAIANETIEVHYQPINNAATREIVGCEALVRWRHPTRGYISPAEFIPIAEELGLMDELGRTILQRACNACASWPERIFVAVNLSPLQVRGGRVANTIKEAVETSGLAPHRLEVEITESTILHDLPSTRQTLRLIRAMGVRISLDDFGTGYSSLSYLHTFPLDKIKIDRSFTMAIGSDQRASIVIASVAGMCKMLGMDVLVEGVETELQMQFVDGLGSVAEVQGFLFSPAVPEKDIRIMFERGIQRKIA